jgi:hypothetical protein
MTWLPVWFLFALVQSQPTVPSPPPNLEAGTFADGVYRNAGLGLVYQFPIIYNDMKTIYESPTEERRVGKKKGPARTGIRIWSGYFKNVSLGSPFTADNGRKPRQRSWYSMTNITWILRTPSRTCKTGNIAQSVADIRYLEMWRSVVLVDNDFTSSSTWISLVTPASLCSRQFGGDTYSLLASRRMT